MHVLKIAVAVPALMLVAMAPAGAQAPPMAMGGAWDPYAGFYAGVNVGGGFGDSTLTSNSSGFTTTAKLDSSGPVGGVQGGYNWRLNGWNPNLILGLEADFDGSGLTSHSGQTVKTIAGATVNSAAARDMEWLGTVRGRIGYNFTPNWLAFVSGGFAYGQVDSSVAGGGGDPANRRHSVIPWPKGRHTNGLGGRRRLGNRNCPAVRPGFGVPPYRFRQLFV
ncbi:MAG TPA: hypothetical protein VFQ90_15720 [Stellaceae bacterium]|jgi:opacity protein-like surface antigen|nr:hypothetical protein [Stellaceae bacterium]